MKELFFAGSKARIRELEHKFNLEVDRLKAQLEQQKKHFEEDKVRTVAQLKKEHDIKLTEAVTLAKLHAEQEIAKVIKDRDAKFNLTTEKLLKENYDKMTAALDKLHSDGNFMTKYVQELSLKMLEKAPTQTNRVELMRGEITE